MTQKMDEIRALIESSGDDEALAEFDAAMAKLAVSETEDRFNPDTEEFRDWLRKGHKSGWVSLDVCISHDTIPLTAEESEQDDPCVHVLRLYPDAETREQAEGHML